MAEVPEGIQRLVRGLLDGAGHTTSALRRAVEARAARRSGGEREGADEVPEELVGYVDKVALHAYKVVDEDVDALKAAGYTEDELFELTLSAALGAGLGRLERSLGALGQAVARDTGGR